VPDLAKALYVRRLFELRRQRARTLEPGRPSPRYLLRGLARCRRCHAKIQGTAAGGGARQETSEVVKRRAALEERLRRMRDLYELGDFTRAEYVSRRQAIHAEPDALAPEPVPDIDRARHALEDFTIFWNAETDPKRGASSSA
jgi:hypothetical protein